MPSSTVTYLKPMDLMTPEELRAKIMEVEDTMTADEWPPAVMRRLRTQRDLLEKKLWESQ